MLFLVTSCLGQRLTEPQAMGVEGRRLYMSMWANAIGITSQEISWAHVSLAPLRLGSSVESVS